MTSTLAAGAAAGSSPEPAHAAAPQPRPRAVLTSLDVLAGGALLLVALVAWASLALAHLGLHSLPAVLGLTALAIVPVGLMVRPQVRSDRAGVLVALACAAVAAALTFPGFSYGVADKDPGGYVSHAVEISRTGDYSFVDPLLATAAQDPTFPVQLTSPGARFAGVWVRDASSGLIVPQFYHLWPALLATAHDAGGRAGLLAAVPLMGVMAVLALCAVLRRVGDALMGDRVGDALMGDRVGDALLAAPGGLVAAGAGGLLLATNELQVWQTRFPTTEVLAQALYLGVLLGVVVALQTGWRPAAGLAGLLVGVGWLNRADGVLLVLIAAGVGAVLLAARRWDGRATWFAAGLLVVAPHALRQAYDLALNYSLANRIPSLPVVAAACAGLLAVGAAIGLADRSGRLAALARSRRAQLVVGVLVVAAAAGLLVLGYLRPRLFGEDLFDYNGREIRSYDEQILARLTWFVSLPGFALMLAGLAVVALRRWSASVWVVVLPTLALFPLYGYTASNSTRMLWWTRRYVPTVLPGIVVLVALAIAFLVVWRLRGRRLTAVPGLLALAGLTAFFLSQSLPLRGHDEWRGSFEVSERIAALSGDREGVYLWEADQGCCAGVTRLFATPVWLQHGQLSGLLPNDQAMAVDGDARRTVIARTAQRFPDRPLFVVADAGQLPVGVDRASVEPVLDLRTTLPMWEESDLERPDEARQVPVHVSVWRVR